MDVITVFFYRFFDKVIYSKNPHLFKIGMNKVYKLLKALYLLKQVLHVWYKTLMEFLHKLDF